MPRKKKPVFKDTGKKPVSKPIGKPLEEAVTPKVESAPKEDRDCQRSDCRHKEHMHYGSKDRWCNTAGCTCQAYQ